MKISDKGIALIKHFEGTELKAYLCPAGVWTIGTGTTKYEDGTPVKSGDEITQERADELLMHDLSNFESCVKRATIGVDLKQCQFDALVSFAYNLGCGALRGSTLIKMVNADCNDPEIRNQFLRWNKAGGKVLDGLTRRREAEANLYFEI